MSCTPDGYDIEAGPETEVIRREAEKAGARPAQDIESRARGQAGVTDRVREAAQKDGR